MHVSPICWSKYTRNIKPEKTKGGRKEISCDVRHPREGLLTRSVVRVWIFWIRCSSPFQAEQLGHDITKSVLCKT